MMDLIKDHSESVREIKQLSEVFGNDESDHEDHESEQPESKYKELEFIYNKVIVTNRKPNYGPPVQRTLKAGAHARKLGIRLKTAKVASEKQQMLTSERQKLKTADSSWSTARDIAESIEITPLPTERGHRVKTNTPHPPNQAHLTEHRYHKQPPSSQYNMKSASTLSRISTLEPHVGSMPSLDKLHSNKVNDGRYSSLAMYSPQTQRFTIEQLAKERTRILKKLSHVQTHRVDKRFFVTGAPCDLRERYNINEDQTVKIETENQPKENAADSELNYNKKQKIEENLEVSNGGDADANVKEYESAEVSNEIEASAEANTGRLLEEATHTDRHTVEATEIEVNTEQTVEGTKPASAIKPGVANETLAKTDDNTVATDVENTVTDEKPVAPDIEPVLADEEPAVADEEPAVADEEPAVADGEPAAADKEPAVADEEPTVADGEPAVADKEPAVADEEPTVANEKPAVADEEPTVADEKPAVADGEPVASTIEPVVV
ncbi:hypothetical protein EB796_001282 [Bugula neritina]|uniref:Uncharacterized protein n=1 Tax=Bugula neritina TaxID=10212 RepID=A0A7J7KQJ2_BUGNE|nr:hypothetical protein EB796_001282 [Bugula neritina]